METVLESVGSCGRFQVIFVLVTRAICLVVSSWGLMFMAFGNFDPGWTCVNNSSAESLNHILNQSGSVNTSVVPFQNSHNSSAQTTEEACSRISSCESIRFKTDVFTIVTEWNLICDDNWIPSMMISIQMVGVLLGSISGGQFAERFGRRKCLYVGVGVHLVSNTFAAVSISWQMFTVARFFIGVGTGLIFAVNQVFPNEFFNHKWRAALTGIPMWAVSMSVFAGTVFLLQNWRHVHIVMALLSLVAFLPVVWTPESMRWLAVQGRMEEMINVAEKVARINGKPAPDRQIARTIAKKEHEQHQNRKRYSFFILFNRQLRWRTIRVTLEWVILSLIYFSINFGVKSLSGNFYLNLFLFALVGIPSILMVTPAARIVGRRWGTVAFFSITILACVSIVIVQFTVTDRSSRGTAMTILALVSTIFLDAGWNVFITFTTELFPTVVRTTAYGFVVGVSRIGAMVAPFIFPQDKDAFYIYYAIMGVLTVICCVITLTFPETKGKPMQDSLSLKTCEKEKELEGHVANVEALLPEK